jgi:hypothetical protein
VIPSIFALKTCHYAVEYFSRFHPDSQSDETTAERLTTGSRAACLRYCRFFSQSHLRFPFLHHLLTVKLATTIYFLVDGMKEPTCRLCSPTTEQALLPLVVGRIRENTEHSCGVPRDSFRFLPLWWLVVEKRELARVKSISHKVGSSIQLLRDCIVESIAVAWGHRPEESPARVEAIFH